MSPALSSAGSAMHGVRRILLVAGTTVVLAGCAHLERISEFPAVQLVVGRDGSTLTVHSALWPQPETRFLVCPGPLPSLGPNLGETDTIAALVPPCVDLGVHRLGPSDDATLDLSLLSAEARARLDPAPEWHLVLLGLGGDHVLRHLSVIEGGPVDGR
jgi:hypothetical protein